MAKRRAKPKSPEQIAAEKAMQREQDFAAVEMQPEAANLATSENVEVRRTGQQTLAGARRLDAFDALRARPKHAPSGNGEKPEPRLSAAAYNAVRQLEQDMRMQRGEVDKVQFTSSGNTGHTPGPMDYRLAAGDRVRRALSLIGERDAWLLSELIYPSRPTENWRVTVSYVTGETHTHAQAAVVRSACANLAAAYSRRAVAA